MGWPMDVKGLIEELPFHKPMRVKELIENHTFHKPMRQRAVCAKRSANGDPMLHLGCAHGGAHCKTVCTRAVSYPLALPLARGQELAHGPMASPWLCHSR